MIEHIQTVMKQIKGAIKGTELLKRLPESTRKTFDEICKYSVEDWRKWHQAVKEKEMERVRRLNQKHF